MAAPLSSVEDDPPQAARPTTASAAMPTEARARREVLKDMWIPLLFVAPTDLDGATDHRWSSGPRGEPTPPQTCGDSEPLTAGGAPRNRPNSAVTIR
ncbi:hypothetical protein GCM10009633_07010 [Janibacter melonis]